MNFDVGCFRGAFNFATASLQSLFEFDTFKIWLKNSFTFVLGKTMNRKNFKKCIRHIF